ncbi:hypothetical protein NQ318_002510 [Aromia moschata]|uniref:Uncharacterized protein n=1 Tax=Aromia moschata TaxID=1265417 RepID=A0AAV8Y7K6_9CUCU|nr:hypothetical protein NQ318_002510 [Aromia moschata]
MEDNIGVKSRARSNSARVLVFDEPKSGSNVERKSACPGAPDPVTELSNTQKESQSDRQNASSNLVKFRNSALGKSAPSLSINMKDTSCVSREKQSTCCNP